MSGIDPREQISSYLDGELQGELLAAFEKALGSDAELAAEVEALRTLVSDLGAMPEVETPAGFAEGVLARVSDLPIPGNELGAEEVGVITETGAPGDIPRLALSAIAGPEGLSGLLRALTGSLWLKVPVGAAAAALLALGFSHLIRPGSSGPPAAEFASLDQASEEESFDGVVALERELAPLPTETSPPEVSDLSVSAPEPLMKRPEKEVRSGSSVVSKRRTARSSDRNDRDRRRNKRKKKSRSAVGDDGVYEAAWESEDGVVLGEEAPSPSGSEFEEEAELEFEVAAAEEAPRDRESFSNTSDITMAGEPLEDHLEPEADKELVEEAGAGIAIDEGVIMMGAARRGGGGGPPAARISARRGDAPSRDVAGGKAGMSASPETMVLEANSSGEPAAPAPATGNVLTVASRARANRLVQDLQSVPAYDLQLLRNPGHFVLEIAYPKTEGGAALLNKLRQAGIFKMKKSAVVRGEQEVLRLDVVW